MKSLRAFILIAMVPMLMPLASSADTPDQPNPESQTEAGAKNCCTSHLNPENAAVNRMEVSDTAGRIVNPNESDKNPDGSSKATK